MALTEIFGATPMAQTFSYSITDSNGLRRRVALPLFKLEPANWNFDISEKLYKMMGLDENFSRRVMTEQMRQTRHRFNALIENSELEV